MVVILPLENTDSPSLWADEMKHRSQMFVVQYERLPSGVMLRTIDIFLR